MKRFLTLGTRRLTLTSSISKKPKEKLRLPSRGTLHYLGYVNRLYVLSICVDQSDIRGGHPVLRMAGIYSLASRVVIWLGPGHDDSILAIRELDTLGSTIEVEWDTVGI